VRLRRCWAGGAGPARDPTTPTATDLQAYLRRPIWSTVERQACPRGVAGRGGGARRVQPQHPPGMRSRRSTTPKRTSSMPLIQGVTQFPCAMRGAGGADPVFCSCRTGRPPWCLAIGHPRGPVWNLPVREGVRLLPKPAHPVRSGAGDRPGWWMTRSPMIEDPPPEGQGMTALEAAMSTITNCSGGDRHIAGAVCVFPSRCSSFPAQTGPRSTSHSPPRSSSRGHFHLQRPHLLAMLCGPVFARAR